MANITRRDPSQLITGREWDPFRLMRDLMRWDPFRELAPLAGEAREYVFVPDFEVKETKDGYVFRADVPGVSEKDIDISLASNRLTISGKREMEKREEGENYFVNECAYGSFTRTFTLPEGINPDQVRAELKNGVLMVHVPKQAEAQPKRIEIQGEAGGAKKPQVKA